MFGLIQPRPVEDIPPEIRKYRNKHFCGICKTLGSTYGQRSRLFFYNYDVSFFAELLSLLEGNIALESNWNSEYHEVSCARVPNAEEGLPKALEYATAVAVFMAAVQIDDHRRDSLALPYEVFARAYSDAFEKAEELLRGWGLPADEIWKNVELQQELERRYSARGDRNDGESRGISPSQVLAELSGPTAEMAAITAEHGAHHVGASDSATLLRELLYVYGSLVYQLDAFADYESDLKKRDFNAIQAAFQTTDPELKGEVREAVIAELRELESKVIECVERLPVPDVQRQEMIRRVRLNMNYRILGRAEVHRMLPDVSFRRKMHDYLVAYRAPHLAIDLTKVALRVLTE